MGTPGVRVFTDAQEHKLAQEYEDGASLNKLASKYGCNPITIRNALLRRGVVLRHRGGVVRGFTDEQVSEMARMWSEGDSQTKIAAHFGTAQTVVTRVLAMHGFKKETRIPKKERHGMWRGGRITDHKGYIGVRPEDDDGIGQAMRDVNGYVREHRLVMAHYLGRPLEVWEQVHHKNGKRDDNRLVNLQLQIGNHGSGIALRCRKCGSEDLEEVPL